MYQPITWKGMSDYQPSIWKGEPWEPGERAQLIARLHDTTLVDVCGRTNHQQLARWTVGTLFLSYDWVHPPGEGDGYNIFWVLQLTDGPYVVFVAAVHHKGDHARVLGVHGTLTETIRYLPPPNDRRLLNHIAALQACRPEDVEIP
jgi:hypothetical protein